MDLSTLRFSNQEFKNLIPKLITYLPMIRIANATAILGNCNTILSINFSSVLSILFILYNLKQQRK